ncbi:uncharacterized protein LAESUDRAFT_372328 [Laetiporus sulphureus 93-53]|uniref:Uncharacterized protein n=1 Tax=Laetiporus sulphureus 93-53 TaxID=1314785 RepID=A0A165CRC6_9APHY|nr:uncharacterized protein LAESUDRAFT_372328 [Laetiporus sulphureus 93-53]KZT03290.1 hypothetical protein LAESUDRAFT_372328 [Laetiporus sulphureus 93-53]
MATASSSRQNSRFSSFNVFKFSPSAKPPPPPPKDPLYACNPSLPSLNHSLPQDLLTSPQQAPLYSQYSKYPRSPSPSPSHAPSRMTMSTTSSSSAVSPEPAGLRKSLQKLSSFGRRPKTPKSPETDPMDLQPPEPADDPSISLPWNFQVRCSLSNNRLSHQQSTA